MLDALYEPVLIGVFVAAFFILSVLLFISAPYGKHERDGWGPGVNMRFGWFILELPAFAVFAWAYAQGSHTLAAAPLILFFLWEIHYFHRTFIYPLRIRVKPGAKYRVLLLAFGMVFNAANGFLNGYYLSEVGTHLDSPTWLIDPRFIIGVSLFVAGIAIAKHSDSLLRNLRKPGETGYRIPYGGVFRWVSCPNYLGELIQWGGFAIAAWSLPGLAFFLFTAANLIPKAIFSHQWYRQQFPDYPAERKAVIPAIL